MITPPPLRQGDTVAIVSPASAIAPGLIDRAVATLRREGFNPVVYPHAEGSSGSYSAPFEERAADISNALLDPEVRAILCSRGGYGCVHLLDTLRWLPVTADPKWVIGFSDVSALHAFMYSRGIESIHGSMAKALANGDTAVLPLLRGQRETVVFGSHPYNATGTASGRLTGGNLAVLQALIATPYDVFLPGNILFIEDIAEPIYKVERILYQLLLAGKLQQFGGLIIGRFTDYHSDRNYRDMYDMIHAVTGDPGYPVAFGAPIGHIDGNVPLIHGAEVTLDVTSENTTITYV